MKLFDLLARQSRRSIWIYGLLGIGVTGIVDYLTGPELAFSVFYIFPIGLVAWYLGRGAGIIAAIIGALAWLQAELLWSKDYSYPLVPFWNATVRGGVFCISAALISEVVQRKKVEQALLNQTSILQSILNSMGDGVIVMDKQGQIILHNPAAERLLRTPLKDTNFEDWVNKQQTYQPDRLTLYPAREHPLLKAIRGNSSDGVEMFFREPQTGMEVWLSATGRPLIENKKGKGGVVVFSDISARRLLEKQISEISDHEQLRLGHDLHDGVCQQLVSTAFAVSVLRQRLAEKNSPEANTAEKILNMINDAISDSRSLARGLFPVKLELDGLGSALEELAENVQNVSNISCQFECDQPVLINDAVTGINVFRIAQEAVNNAVKHSSARNIVIELEAVEEEVTLVVRDDGIGFSVEQSGRRGMGLHIMNYRARLIGAALEVRRAANGGTSIICSFLNGNHVNQPYDRNQRS